MVTGEILVLSALACTLSWQGKFNDFSHLPRAVDQNDYYLACVAISIIWWGSQR